MEEGLLLENLLATILSPADVKQLNRKQLMILALEIRNFLIKSLAKTGGHLASNLGVVELTLALHYCFETPKDKIIWDVGHQSYVHKILTGRQNEFKTLRTMNGLSGFPKLDESKHDIFGTGHSATSISAGLGMATARDLKGENHSVISVIGDGSMTGGMAFEALNHAGRGNTNIIVILNDNEMSISQNVGGLSTYLNKMRTGKVYLNAKQDIEKVLKKIPMVGKHMVSVVRKTKEGIKSFLVPGSLFESLGFTYIGPVDGHNMDDLLHVLGQAKVMTGPILIHVKTTKGKGYSFAEKRPERYHGVSPFVPETGTAIQSKTPDTYSGAFGQSVIELGARYKELVTITAAMPEGTGLEGFSKIYPNRFFDVGIAEQHAVTFAAGLAIEGYKPIVAIYSTFYQRAYDQIIHDICIQKLAVVLAIDRAGVVGEDGSTHQGVFDLSFLISIPNITILAPKNYAELDYMLNFALEYQGPVAIRYPRGSEGEKVSLIPTSPIEYGRSEMLKEGHTIALVGIGKMVEIALEAADLLRKKGIKPYVINARFAKPIDIETLKEIAGNIKHIVTLEDHMIAGGFGESLGSLISKDQEFSHISIEHIGYPDEFIEHGSIQEIYKKYQLDKQSVAKTVENIIKL